MNTSSSQTSSQQLTDSNFNDSQFPSSIQHPESSDQDRAPSAFTNPETLHSIGQPRLVLFLRRFAPELQNAGLAAPPTDPSINGEYFEAFADLLRSPALPEP